MKVQQAQIIKNNFPKILDFFFFEIICFLKRAQCAFRVQKTQTHFFEKKVWIKVL